MFSIVPKKCEAMTRFRNSMKDIGFKSINIRVNVRDLIDNRDIYFIVILFLMQF